MPAHTDVSSSLDLLDSRELATVLPAHVAQAIPAESVSVFTVTDDASDTAAFSAKYGFGLEDCANTIVLRYKKDGGEHFAAVVSLGSLRLDVNGAVKAVLGAQRLSFAKREQAVEESRMEFGAITAFGLPADWRILVDSNVVLRDRVVMGAGVRHLKLLLDPKLLASVPNCEVAELTSSGS